MYTIANIHQKNADRREYRYPKYADCTQKAAAVQTQPPNFIIISVSASRQIAILNFAEISKTQNMHHTYPANIVPEAFLFP